ncbi:MAG: hypothetical protein M1561_03585, partial [Gammaproteobacteria bacterium]|nr:hypothetical protein [Gammaproteobacteria bacterium]
MSEPIRAFFIWKPDEYINKSRSAIEVMFPVSMGTDQKDRHKQSGKYLDTLITLLEEYAPKNQKFGIKKITIVTGGDIYKLYWSEEAAKNTEAVWLEKESKKFDKLQALGMEVEFIFWNEILKTKAYRLLRRSVDKLYATHKQFVDLINEAISVHASKVYIYPH